MGARGNSAVGAVLACGAALALTACTSKQEKHDAALETAWAACEQGALKTEALEDDVAALEEFLSSFPADDPLGNAHAAEAQSRLEASRSGLQSRAIERQRLAARAARVGKANPALAALVAKVLFSLATTVRPQNRYDDPTPLAVVSLEHEGFRLLTRGRLATSLWDVGRGDLRDEVQARLQKVLGAQVYEPKTKRLDVDALQDLLDAAYVAPGAPLLGRTALQLYPLFRPLVRAQARLYRVIDAERAPIRKFESSFQERLTNLLVRAGEAGVPGDDGRERTFEQTWSLIATDMPGQLFGGEGLPPFGEDGTGYVTSWNDRRLFYRAVTVELSLDRKAGIRRAEFSCLDTGFWLRRLEDGSAGALAGFLERVLRDYDAAWLGELDAMKGKWHDPAPPALAPDPGDRAASPPRAPSSPGPLEGDRLVSLGLEADALAAAFDADAGVLSLVSVAGLERYSRTDATSLLRKPLRAGGRAPERATFSGDGSRFAATFGTAGQGGPVQVFLTETGELVESFELPWVEGPLGLNQDGTRLAVTVQGRSRHEVAVRQTGARRDAGVVAPPDGGALDSTPRNFSGTFLALISSPTSTSLLTAGDGKLTLIDVDTGAVRGTEAQEGLTSSTAASPDGSKIIIPSSEAITVLGLDVATAKFSALARLKPLEYAQPFLLPNAASPLLRTDDGRIRIVDLAHRGLEPGFIAWQPLAVSPDGTLLVTRAPERELLFYSLARAVTDAGVREVP